MQERKFNINGHPNDLAALDTVMAFINMVRRDKTTGEVKIFLDNQSILPSFTEADGKVVWHEDDKGQLDVPIEPIRIGGERLPVAELQKEDDELVLIIELGCNHDGRSGQ